MKLKHLKIKGFKNLTGENQWFELDFTDKDGITVLIGNNGSGKSNVLEALSAIFIGLYKIGTPQRKPTFSYSIEYSIGTEVVTDIKIELINGTYGFYLNDVKELKKDFFEWADKWLPSKIIACYSGEETRLWETYYKHSYSDFITSIKNNELRYLPEQKLFYIDGGYWNEALLVFLLSELDSNKNFVLNNLGITSVESIEFKVNKNNLEKYQPNMITEFVNRLSNDQNSVIISFNDLKAMISEYEYELFIKLISASQSELITLVKINFNNHLSTEDLSEGQKKQILIRAILEFIADRSTLVLLDEPDSHIHVANKVQFKNLLEEYEYKNLILTSHSPTLMNVFESHLEYLENGQIKGSEKAEILKEISGDTMSITEQQIVLNTANDIILVEGKLDIKFLTTAIQKINLEKYNGFENFGFISTGGASGLRLFIDKFTAKDNQNIIAILDHDKAGSDEVKEVLTPAYQTILDREGYVKINELKNTYLLKLPKLSRINNIQFEIEDFFPLAKLTNISKNRIDTFKVLKDFTLKKDTVKKQLALECETYTPADYEDFKEILELIYKIKNPS